MNPLKYQLTVSILFLAAFLFVFVSKALGATCTGGAFQTFTTYSCGGPPLKQVCIAGSQTIWQGCFWLGNICLHSVPASQGCHVSGGKCFVTPGSPGGGTSSSGCSVCDNSFTCPTQCGQTVKDGCGGSHVCGTSDVGKFGPWSSCSVSCGGGTQTRTDPCGNTQTQSCNTQPCGGPPPPPPPTPTPTPTPGPPGPWWQTKDADVTTNGDIVSGIPSSCTLPGCNPTFDLDGSGGYPGIPLYGGINADFRAGAGVGTVSSKGWIVNTSYMGKTYSYNYFAAQGPKVDCATDPTSLCYNLITTPSVNGGDFNSGGTSHRGYVWYKKVGDLTINGNVNLVGSRKVVLLVEGGDLNINGRVNLQAPGIGYFMAIVGKDGTGGKGNIIVDPSVTHPTQPGLEGMYLADAQFKTGAGSSKLWLKGSVVAYDGIVFQRDLGAGNPTAPAEYFEYDPTLIFTYPRELTRHGIIWREVAP